MSRVTLCGLCVWWGIFNDVTWGAGFMGVWSCGSGRSGSSHPLPSASPSGCRYDPLPSRTFLCQGNPSVSSCGVVVFGTVRLLLKWGCNRFSTGVGREFSKKKSHWKKFHHDQTWKWSMTKRKGGKDLHQKKIDLIDMKLISCDFGLVVLVRNSEGCEDTHQPVRDVCQWWGGRSKRHHHQKN